MKIVPTWQPWFFILAVAWASVSRASDAGISIESVLDCANGSVSRLRLCGPLSVYRIIAQADAEITFEKLLKQFHLTSDGVAISEVLEAVKQAFPKAEMLRFIKKEQVFQINNPAILVVNGLEHCVVFEGFDEARGIVHVWEPSTLQSQEVGRDVFLEGWQGDAIVVSRDSTQDNWLGIVLIACANLCLLVAIIRSHRKRSGNRLSAQPHSAKGQ